MKARVLKRLLNNTGYQISERKAYIAVGSGMCHNLISVDKSTLIVKYALDTFDKGREAIDHDELKAIWDKLHELIASGEIRDIIEGGDDIPNPLPVYTVEDGQLIESVTDEYGWPNVTADGRMMFNNTHFKTKKEAIAYGIESITISLKWIDEHILEAEAELAKKRDQHARYTRQLIGLRVLSDEVLDKKANNQ